MRPKPGSEGTTGDRQVNLHQWGWGRFVIAIGVEARDFRGPEGVARRREALGGFERTHH